jgi:hypothetical protein
MRHAYVKRVVASVTGSGSNMIDTGSVELAVDVGGASGALIHFLMKQNLPCAARYLTCRRTRRKPPHDLHQPNVDTIAAAGDRATAQRGMP